ncbi:MAG: DNA mismatch repair protein MutT [Actinobacteria bacterium]|nr:DNA mismatch repair protein MutT [Actinomycetota bacterium]
MRPWPVASASSRTGSTCWAVVRPAAETSRGLPDLLLKRPAARVVLLDRDDRIFLVNAEDPLDPFKPDWWEIPGGGIDWGENSATAAARELYEETGIEDVEMGPVIWTQHVQFTFGGFHFDSREKIHVARCDGGEYRPKHLEALEAAAFMGAQWWAVDDLLESEVMVLPELLREHLPAVVAGHLPDSPVDISPRPIV